MEQVTTEMFSSQEQEIKELRKTVCAHDKELNNLIDFLIDFLEDVAGAKSRLLNLRMNRDLR